MQPDSPGTTDEKLHRLIAATLGKGSQMTRENEMYLAIEALTKEDFHRFTAEKNDLVELADKVGGIYGVSGPLASALIARWLTVEPDAVPMAAPRLLDLLPKGNLRNSILDELTAKRPVEMIALVPSRKDAASREEIIARALRELAARDPRKAREWLAHCTDAADRRAAEKALRAGIVQADPLQAPVLAALIDSQTDPSGLEASGLLDKALEHAAKMGPGVLRQLVAAPLRPWMTTHVLFVLDRHDPELAVDFALHAQAEGGVDARGLQDAFSALAGRNPAQAIAKLEGLSGPQLAGAVSAIGYEWAAREPVAALAWLMDRPAAESRDALARAFAEWAHGGQDDARAWADALPEGATRDAVQAQLASVLAGRGQPAEAIQVLARMGHAANPKTIGDIAGAWALHDPQAAADWAIAQPAGPVQSRALASVVGAWANDNPAGVRDWLAQFPPGETRDRSVAAYLSRNSAWTTNYADQVAEFDQWFDMIDDPWTRARAAVSNFWWRKQSDPAGARTWLAALPNVDPEMIRVTLRDSRN